MTSSRNKEIQMLGPFSKLTKIIDWTTTYLPPNGKEDLWYGRMGVSMQLCNVKLSNTNLHLSLEFFTKTSQRFAVKTFGV